MSASDACGKHGLGQHDYPQRILACEIGK